MSAETTTVNLTCISEPTRQRSTRHTQAAEGCRAADMVQRTAPTVLTAKNINGVIHSSSHGSVSWNSDGQCAFSHRRGVVILARYALPCMYPKLMFRPHISPRRFLLRRNWSIRMKSLNTPLPLLTGSRGKLKKWKRRMGMMMKEGTKMGMYPHPASDG